MEELVHAWAMPEAEEASIIKILKGMYNFVSAYVFQFSRSCTGSCSSYSENGVHIHELSQFSRELFVIMSKMFLKYFSTILVIAVIFEQFRKTLRNHLLQDFVELL